eukprot:scaffold111896_cov18-Tisochrysis_lutea.AAC.1
MRKLVIAISKFSTLKQGHARISAPLPSVIYFLRKLVTAASKLSYEPRSQGPLVDIPSGGQTRIRASSTA